LGELSWSGSHAGLAGNRPNKSSKPGSLPTTPAGGRPRGHWARNGELARYLNVSKMTIWRWKHQPHYNFPVAAKIDSMEFNDLDKVDAWSRALNYLYGAHAMEVQNPEHVIGKHNPHLERLIKLTADEALFAGDPRHRNALYGLITEPGLTIEPKFVNPYRADNYLNIDVISNALKFIPVTGFNPVWVQGLIVTQPPRLLHKKINNFAVDLNEDHNLAIAPASSVSALAQDCHLRASGPVGAVISIPAHEKTLILLE
jgi:hypothetical protein